MLGFKIKWRIILGILLLGAFTFLYRAGLPKYEENKVRIQGDQIVYQNNEIECAIIKVPDNVLQNKKIIDYFKYGNRYYVLLYDEINRVESLVCFFENKWLVCKWENVTYDTLFDLAENSDGIYVRQNESFYKILDNTVDIFLSSPISMEEFYHLPKNFSSVGKVIGWANLYSKIFVIKDNATYLYDIKSGELEYIFNRPTVYYGTIGNTSLLELVPYQYATPEVFEIDTIFIHLSQARWPIISRRLFYYDSLNNQIIYSGDQNGVSIIKYHKM